MPSAKEAGINYEMSIWAGIFAPKGMSKEVVDKLAAALDKALDDPTVQKRLGELGGIDPAEERAEPRDLRSPGEGGDRALVADPQGCLRKHELSMRSLSGPIMSRQPRCAPSPLGRGLG